MLCVECGKREAKYDNLCEECFLKKVKFTHLPRHMEITQCPHCGAVKFRGEWKRLDRKEMFHELVMRNLTVLHEYDAIDVDIKEREERGVIHLDVKFHIRFKDLKIIEEHFCEVTINYESCTRCNRYFGNYFEAILQLRGMREGEREKVREFAYSRIEYYAEKNENLFVTKEEEKKEGVDLYLSDKREAKKVARDICDRYGASLKESPQLAGRKDGHDVYRVTYAVRLPDYRSGDVVQIDNIFYLVEKVSRSMLFLLSLKDGRRKHVDTKRHKIERIIPQNELEEAMVIYSHSDYLQLMDKDYNILEVKSPFKHPNGSKIKIARINGEVLVLP